MNKQLSDCCKAEIVGTGEKKPNEFACGKCWRIIGTPINSMTKQLKDMNKTLENLEVGDLVKSGELILTIHVVLYKTEDNTGYILENKSGCVLLYSAKKLAESGYTPYTEISDEIEKAMEVLERNGRIVDGKIIK